MGETRRGGKSEWKVGVDGQGQGKAELRWGALKQFEAHGYRDQQGSTKRLNLHALRRYITI